MVHKYDEPVYLISIVANILDIHPQTLRQYEREGLITPSRTDGKRRMYSQKDIDRIKLILRLTRDIGVNLAGVDVALQLKDRIAELECEVAELKEKLAKLNSNGTIPAGKSLVTKESKYKIVLFEE
jgi:MerR family transcriptional regulator/heat shock protein HspR